MRVPTISSNWQCYLYIPIQIQWFQLYDVLQYHHILHHDVIEVIEVIEVVDLIIPNFKQLIQIHVQYLHYSWVAYVYICYLYPSTLA